MTLDNTYSRANGNDTYRRKKVAGNKRLFPVYNGCVVDDCKCLSGSKTGNGV